MAQNSTGRPGLGTQTLILDELLARVRYQVDADHPHIQIRPEECRQCDRHPCLRVCPAGVYRLAEGGMEALWERCLECGACRQVCQEPALHWEHPRGGRGVSFRLG